MKQTSCKLTLVCIAESDTLELQEAISKGKFQHDVSNLEPATTYSLYLKAYSPLGASQQSHAVVATTLGGGTGTNPSLSKSSFEAENLKLRTSVLQDLLWVPGLPLKTLFFSFLHPAPTPPTFFTKVVNSSSVQVLWELPSKAGKAEGFRLFYRRVPHALFQGPIQLPCLVNAHTIADLGTHMLQILYSSVF